MALLPKPAPLVKSENLEPVGAPSKRLAVCMDDFGLHRGVNQAASRLAELGRLNGVGCMVGAPAWLEGAGELSELRSASIDLGLHLDFTEYPLMPASRHGLRPLIGRAYARRLDPAALRSEIEAQFDAFEQGIGRPPDYVDGHQHVHQLPMIRDALAAVLERRSGAPRPWLRCTRRASTLISDWKPWVIQTLGAAALSRLAALLGCAQNARLLGAYDFDGDALQYRHRLSGWLAVAGDGDVLMCHPSVQAAVHDPLLAARVNEYTELARAPFAAMLERFGVTLAPISCLER